MNKIKIEKVKETKQHIPKEPKTVPIHEDLMEIINQYTNQYPIDKYPTISDKDSSTESSYYIGFFRVKKDTLEDYEIKGRSFLTLVHEMTHVKQYIEFNLNATGKEYEDRLIYESEATRVANVIRADFHEKPRLTYKKQSFLDMMIGIDGIYAYENYHENNFNVDTEAPLPSPYLELKELKELPKNWELKFKKKIEYLEK